jgi:tetratricopeptide (TPR) repeat protein
MKFEMTVDGFREMYSSGKFAEIARMYSATSGNLPPDRDSAEITVSSLLKINSPSDAIRAAVKAAELFPDCENFHFMAGLAWEFLNDKKKALEFYGRALSVNPDFVPAICNMAKILLDGGKIHESRKFYKKALKFSPESFEVNLNAGNVEAAAGNIRKAIDFYRAAHEISPENPAATGNILMNMHYNYDYSAEQIYREHLRFARLMEKSNPPIRPEIKKTETKKIRLGFVSADFRRHSVAYFAEPLFHYFDRQRFEIFCYYDSFTRDEVTERFMDMADSWTGIRNMNNRETAVKIRSDGIDVLFDLAGHTGPRMPVFAMRPAPVQISYIGYVNTTGLRRMDYVISDNDATPPGTDKFYSEKIIRLEGCSLCFAPPAEVPESTPPPSEKNGFITFGSMNNLSKINDDVIQTWTKILKAVPESKILLKNKSFSDEKIRKTFFGKFSDNGIDGSRVELIGFLPKLSAHMELYNKIDIALDTFPFNGVTTTCEALWMGVPVITLAGCGYTSRIASSILGSISMKAFRSNSLEDYIKKAVMLSGNAELLNELRRSLRVIMASSSLCAAERKTREIEAICISLVKHNHNG